MSAGEREIVERLSDAQRRALLAMPLPYTMHTEMQGDVECSSWATATELGVSGRTLSSLNGFGGLDLKTLLCGPILVTYDWGDTGKRYWTITKEGLAVRLALHREGLGGE